MFKFTTKDILIKILLTIFVNNTWIHINGKYCSLTNNSINDIFILNIPNVCFVLNYTPLITGQTLKNLIQKHIAENNAITVLTAISDDATEYGRIIKDSDGKFVKIVEQKDASIEEQKVNEINSGMYIFNSDVLTTALSHLHNDNAQNEYYLTDTIEIVKGMQLGEVSTLTLNNIAQICHKNC